MTDARSRRPPDLDPQAMLVFAALARAGGVRSAAAILAVPRSTVSRRLAQLEETLGAPLVVRTARRFALTELGVVFAARCEALEVLLADAAAAVQRGSAEVAGTLRIAAAPVFGEDVLPGVLATLLAKHPRLSVDLRLSVDYVDLRRGDVDVAVRAWPLDDASDLFAVRLGTSITGCWASPSYARARGLPTKPAELASHECILVGSAPQVSWSFKAGTREEAVIVTGRARVDSFRVARDLAAAGGGIVRTAFMLASPLVREGLLVPVLEKHWLRTPIHAVHAGANPPAAKVRALIGLLKQALPATP
ncbi:MAG TPA: LysR family transcriptional regulator [Labilithrix sp.]|nr:LysR family transcriptional regulator [Labilithrix sp.]